MPGLPLPGWGVTGGTCTEEDIYASEETSSVPATMASSEAHLQGHHLWPGRAKTRFLDFVCPYFSHPPNNWSSFRPRTNSSLSPNLWQGVGTQRMAAE